MKFNRTIFLRWMIAVILCMQFGLAWAKSALIYPEVGFLVVAPDRGFLGNEEVRDVYQAFSEQYTATLVFATGKKTANSITAGINVLKRKKVKIIHVLPLFLSPANILYQKAIGIVNTQKWGVPVIIGETMNESYLIEETLKKRIMALSKHSSKEVLVVVGSGAVDQKGEAAIKEDLEAMVQRVIRSFDFSATEIVVLYDRVSEKSIRKEAYDRAMDRIAINQEKGERVLIVPFNFGMKATHMMSEWNRLSREIAKFDKIVADGNGVIPDENVGIWLKKEANRRLPLSDDEIGVVLMPHGADFNWNETIRENLTPLLARHKIEYAFSMADPLVIERAVKRLEKQGVRAIILVRVYSMASSFREKTEYILGLNNANRHGAMAMRITTPVLFVTLGGTENDPLVAEVMLERAKNLSKNPGKETLILLAHGTDDEDVNRRWMENLADIAGQIRKNGGSIFKDIKYHTWQEDWPDKREQATAVIRNMVKEASQDGGVAILIPDRTTGQGHADELLEGVKYRYATGFAPHPNFLKWVEGQIQKGKVKLRAR